MRARRRLAEELAPVKGEGCKGGWGATMIMSGRHMGQAGGFYEIACDELHFQSDTAALLCDCR